VTSRSPLDAFQVRGAVVIGTDGYLVGVSAVSSDGHPGLQIEGLAAINTWPARDRIRAAILNSGLPWPAHAVTVSLTPVRMPERGDSLDLAIAVAVLATAGSIPPSAADSCLLFAALGLDGKLRPTPGIRAAAVAAAAAGCPRLIVASSQADEADEVPGIAVTGCRTLAEVRARLRHGLLSPPVLHAHRLASLERRTAPLPDLGEIPQPPSGHLMQSGYAWIKRLPVGWCAEPVWGREGWDLGAWPLAIVALYIDADRGLHAVATYTEGDVTAKRYAGRGALYVAVNEIAEFHWRLGQAQGPDDLPEDSGLLTRHCGPYRGGMDD